MSKQKIASAELVSSSSEKAGTNGVDKNNLTIKTNASGKEIGQKIWAVADRLRGAVDSWDFKQFIFNFIFYKVCSDKVKQNLNDPKRLKTKKYKECFNVERYEDITKFTFDDKDEDVEKELEKNIELSLNALKSNLFLLPHMLFDNVYKNRWNLKNVLVDVIQRVFDYLNKNNCIKGMFSNFRCDDVRLGPDRNARNEKLLSIIEELNEVKFSEFKTNVDLLGDAFEFLMSMYASNGGKSGGEFYTPKEVSELLASLAVANKTEISNAYDPACGSGSLLLKIKHLVDTKKIKFNDEDEYYFYGHEINLTTSNLCKMNMILHEVDPKRFKVDCIDTLLSGGNALEENQTFDVIVSNPPYSIKWVGEDNQRLKDDKRFCPEQSNLPLAPKSKADLAFVMHCLHYLSKNQGTAAIVCFPGIFYREGAEFKIRQYLVENNYIDAIISLPSNLFYGTSISTCILILKKGKKDENILFIDASDRFEKGNNKNFLKDEDINFIVDLYKKRETSENSYLATLEEVNKNKYNLVPSRYITNTKKEVIDIIKLEEEIKRITARSNQLRKELDEILDKELRSLLKELEKEDQMPKKN